MVRHVCKCTTEEGRRTKGKDWNVKPAEIDKFIGFVIARKTGNGHTLPLKSMWSAPWKTMRKDRFVDIVRTFAFRYKN